MPFFMSLTLLVRAARPGTGATPLVAPTLTYVQSHQTGVHISSPQGPQPDWVFYPTSQALASSWIHSFLPGRTETWIVCDPRGLKGLGDVVLFTVTWLK